MAQFQAFSETEKRELQIRGSKAWQQWAERHQAAIVHLGGPLGRTKRVSRSGIEDSRNNLGAFVMVQAESQQAAAQLFEQHPHFMIFPGDAVEVMECLPVPS